MAQVLKPEVHARIQNAALQSFATQGYAGTSMAAIAAAAGTAPGNLYRYVASKEALFDAVVPADLVVRHDALLDRRVAALADRSSDSSAAATELLEFWLDHRLAIVVLLDRSEGTPYADYPAAFSRRMAEHARASLPGRLSGPHGEILDLVFDNTRRAIARILLSAQDRDHARALVSAFWSYQIPGLDGLLSHRSADDDAHAPRDEAATAAPAQVHGSSIPEPPRNRDRPASEDLRKQR